MIFIKNDIAMDRIPDQDISLSSMLNFLRGRQVEYMGKMMLVRNYYTQPSFEDVYGGEVLHIVCDCMTIRLNESYAYQVVKAIVDHNIPLLKTTKKKYTVSDETRESNRNLDR